MTNKLLPHLSITPNRSLRTLIQRYRDEQVMNLFLKEHQGPDRPYLN